MDRALTHSLLTNLALSVYNATDVRADDVRAVREEAQRALPDLDPSLVEDLLISAISVVNVPDLDIDAVTRLWGAAALRDAAPRLIAVLNGIYIGP